MAHCENLRLECERLFRECLDRRQDNIGEFEPLSQVEGPERTRITDLALRNVLWGILDEVQGNNDDDPSHKEKLTNLVDLMVYLCERELASPNLPATIFTDIFDTLTISRCEKLFHLMEDKVEIWKKPLFFGHCKNQMLRMCNDLLRRLSKSQNTVFCGQILIVLAKLFPLSERSGLNIVSEFNSENISIHNGDELDGNTSAEEGHPKVSHNLHRNFWSLQDFFRQPTLCYDENNWRQMTKCSNEVLTTFSSFKLDEQGVSSKSQPYFAKYLTSRRLFQLELSDSNFRRCILIQFLIMFQYLKATVRFKLEKHFLSEYQAQWVREKTEEIYKLLQETPPDGQEFARAIESILAREEHWNAWKNDNCPAFKVADVMGRKCGRKRKKVGDDVREHLEQGQIAMGSPELNKLFNICSDHWEACRVERRCYVPSMSDFFEEAIAQADPAACIEEQYKLVSNPNWGWRALRILSQKSLHFFTSTNQPAKSLPNYLDTMVGFLAKDLCINRDAKETNGVVRVEEDDNSQDDFKEEENDAANNEVTTRGSDLNPSNQNNGVDEEPPGKRSRIVVQTALSEAKETLSAENIDRLANILAEDCARLAPLMGLNEDELQYIQSSHEDSAAQAKHLLTLWKENETEKATMTTVKQLLAKAGLSEKLQLL